MKSRYLIISFIAVFVLTISVGYSALNETFSISGEATFIVNSDIDFVESSVHYNKQAQVIETLKLDSTNIEGLLSLDSLESYLVYKITLVNNSGFSIIFQNSEITNFSNENISYDVIGLDSTSIIHANERYSFLVSFKYKDELQELPSITTLDFRIKFNFSSTSKESLVSTDSLLLYVTEADKKYDEFWFDRSFNKDVSLNNVTDSTAGYRFSGTNSCGLTNRTVVPTVGDFTVEIKFTTSASITGDISVLAQKIMSTTERERGRTKFFNLFNGIIRFFAITSIDNDTITPTYFNTIESNNTYYLVVKREGEFLYLYVNGILFKTEAFDSLNELSSGPMQIGCYDAINSQNFNGSIHLLRVYGRALDDTQIHNNFLESSNTEVSGETNLITNMVTNQLVTSGSGLYYIAEDDEFLFKGENISNYLKIDNELWRIISIENDNTIKIVRVSNIAKNIPFDMSSNRSSLTSSYCTNADSNTNDSFAPKYGCNVWPSGNITYEGTSLGDTIAEASIVGYLNNDIYNGFSEDLKSRIIEAEFNVGLVPLNATYNAVKQREQELKWTGKVGTITALDILNASVTTTSISNLSLSNYLTSISNDSTFVWTMNGVSSNSWDVWTIVNGRSLGPRRGSRVNQVITTTNTADLAVTPVVHIDGNIEVSGTGSLTTPYSIN